MANPPISPTTPIFKDCEPVIDKLAFVKNSITCPASNSQLTDISNLGKYFHFSWHNLFIFLILIFKNLGEYMENAIEYIFRIILSAILGALIGYERQFKHKSAGLRTNILVCIGSCLIMILSNLLYEQVEGKTNADPARLAAQVVSGIGFLGAGAIIKEGVNVIGLTTAACIWVVSGVGLAVGAGYYIIAVFASLLVYIILEILSQMDSWLVPTDNIMIKIRMINDSEKIKEVYNALLKLGLKSKNFSVVFVSEDIVELNILMFNPHKLKLAEISTYFTSMEGVIKSIEIH